MILIAHRGNTCGADPTNENSPEYINKALNNGFNVEVDVWYKDGDWFLGHDSGQYVIDFKFLEQECLWLHTKDYNTFSRLLDIGEYLNFFYHTNEDYVLTSQGFIWAFPGMYGGKDTICVLPEINNTPTENFGGICSDYVVDYIND